MYSSAELMGLYSKLTLSLPPKNVPTSNKGFIYPCMCACMYLLLYQPLNKNTALYNLNKTINYPQRTEIIIQYTKKRLTCYICNNTQKLSIHSPTLTIIIQHTLLAQLTNMLAIGSSCTVYIQYVVIQSQVSAARTSSVLHSN